MKEIKQTLEGYPVKDIRWDALENIYKGLVKDPVTRRDSFNAGYCTCKWRRNGTNLKDKNRTDLNLAL